MGDNIIGNLYRYTLHFVKFTFYFIFAPYYKIHNTKGQNIYLSQERRDTEHIVINYIYLCFI